MRVIDKETIININSDEKTPLMVEQKDKEIIAKPATQSTTWRIVSFGANSSLIAIQMIGNGIMLSSLGPTEQAASSLITAIQSFISGTTFGFLTNTGVELGAAIGKSDTDANNIDAKNEKIESIIKTSWLVGSGLCLMGTAGFLSTRYILPHILDPETAEAVGQFFTMFSIGAFSEPMAGNNGLIIAQVEKNMVLPLLIAAAYRLPAIGLGYYFSKTLKMGVSGLGLGIAVAGVTAFLGSQALLMRSTYKSFNLYNRLIPNFGKHLKSYLNNGWKLSLQRITEWGNLVALTTLIGVLNNSSLQALQPAIQANTLIGLAMQGIGQASMMFVVQDIEKQKKQYKIFKSDFSRDALEEYRKSIEMNKYTFIKNNVAGLAIAIALSAAIYLARKPVIELFLGSNISAQQDEMAQSLMLVTLLGLIPDTLRIVSGGILRGWGDLLYPTLMSLLLMTVVGVPVGAGISLATEKSILSIMWVRFVTILLSAAFNCYRFYQHNNNDKKLYMDGDNLLKIYAQLDQFQRFTDNYSAQNEQVLSQRLTEYGFTISLVNNFNFFDEIAQMMENFQGEERYSGQQLMISLSELIHEKINDYTRQFSCDKETFINNLLQYENDRYIVIKALVKLLNINIVVIHEGNPVTKSIFQPQCQDLTQERTVYLYQSRNGQYHVLRGEPTQLFTALPSTLSDNDFAKINDKQQLQAPRFGSIFYRSSESHNNVSRQQQTAVSLDTKTPIPGFIRR